MARRRVEIKTGTAGLCLAVLGTLVLMLASARAGETDPPRWSVSPKGDAVPAAEIKKWRAAGEDFLILDARGKFAFDAGHVDGAVLALSPGYYREAELFVKGALAVPPDPHAALVEAMKGVPRNKKIIAYCNAGCAAATALLVELKGLGFTNVREMEGGYQAWMAGGSSEAVRH
ncbi:MAG: rhodanese-like domain-containing protein [Candidatus Omnitrophica bacterium]|nr:rhodanese-like domain-containing protein [Candidatus Omnitrophota bacterium]